MKIDKKFIVFTIVLLLIISGLFYYYKYLPDKKQKEQEIKRANEIIDYKKAYFSGVFCQYNCPLENQVVNNKTQELPSLDCVKNCTEDFIAKYSDNNFTNKELTGDNLLIDMKDITDDCKTESYDINKFVLNNSQYFSCSIEKLVNLKKKYSYLI